ncbi:hypothetical protein BDC45DRAFT_538510 [Circinella umbellata]|nr:hypothetical protein BDC45DRAFT_538510 [Circinella umbellata]
MSSTVVMAKESISSIQCVLIVVYGLARDVPSESGRHSIISWTLEFQFRAPLIARLNKYKYLGDKIMQFDGEDIRILLVMEMVRFFYMELEMMVGATVCYVIDVFSTVRFDDDDDEVKKGGIAAVPFDISAYSPVFSARTCCYIVIM